jgi:hypothetical protein
MDRPAGFTLRVNYPWLNYAEDFSVSPAGHFGLSLAQSRETVEREFAEIRESGASVVRWFLFGDGRSGFLSKKGTARGGFASAQQYGVLIENYGSDA